MYLGILFLILICVFLQRLFPRAWFCIAGFHVNVLLACTAFFADKLRYLGISHDRTTGFCALLCNRYWRTLFYLNPQIRTEECGSTANVNTVPLGSFILVNHTSMIDSVFATQWMPIRIILRARGIVKASLSKVPIIGPIFIWCGHFPVYFTGVKATDFGVDRERQSNVTANLEAYVASKKGYLLFSPEGVINSEPDCMLPFRYGSFTFALKYKVPIYALVHDGCQVAWPKRSLYGGTPSTIRYRFIKINVNYDDEQTAVTIADTCREQMQAHLDELIKKR